MNGEEPGKKAGVTDGVLTRGVAGFGGVVVAESLSVVGRRLNEKVEKDELGGGLVDGDSLSSLSCGRLAKWGLKGAGEANGKLTGVGLKELVEPGEKNRG